MATPYNIKGDLLVQGINCKVRVDLNDPNGSNPIVIGFVSNYSVSENIGTAQAQVLGDILPVSIDPTSVSVSVDLTGFIPSAQLVKSGIEVRGGGQFTVKSFNPDTQKLTDTKVITKIPYLDLYDEKHKSIIGSSSWLIPTRFSDSSHAQNYTEASISLTGIGYDNGSDYEPAI